jgi:hypothetical protein
MFAGGLLESPGTGLKVTVSPPTSRSFVGIFIEDGGGGDGAVGIDSFSSTDGTD